MDGFDVNAFLAPLPDRPTKIKYRPTDWSRLDSMDDADIARILQANPEGITPKQISDLVGVERVAVCNLEKKALSKLRNDPRTTRLLAFLDDEPDL